jgi:K+-transporting ATPase ATPase B chain
VLGVVELSDVVKHGIKEKFARLRAMGIKTVMITGDNPLTAAAIAAEAGVDDYIAEATPGGQAGAHPQRTGRWPPGRDGRRRHQRCACAGAGRRRPGDELRHAGGEGSRQHGRPRFSDPAKLLAVVEVGKQQLITRGALTTFSLANDVSKYFAILPALFAAAIPSMATLNVMGLSSPKNAVLAALIFNALVIPR